MIKKTEAMFFRVSENIFIKYYKAGEKLKDFLSPIFNPENKERGLVISGTTLLIVGIAAAVLAGVGYVSVKNTVAGAEADFFTALVLGIGLVFVMLGQAVFGFAAGFLTRVLDPQFINGAITSNQVFSTVWGNVRDLANMIIVMGFVVVGIATALRIQEYAAKKILWRLILIALVINFSGLFCGLIIDLSNITMNGLLGGSSAQTNIESISLAITNYVNNALGETAKLMPGGGIISTPPAPAAPAAVGR